MINIISVVFFARLPSRGHKPSAPAMVRSPDPPRNGRRGAQAEAQPQAKAETQTRQTQTETQPQAEAETQTQRTQTQTEMGTQTETQTQTQQTQTGTGTQTSPLVRVAFTVVAGVSCTFFAFLKVAHLACVSLVAHELTLSLLDHMYG